MTPTHSVIVTVHSATGARLTALVERRESSASARGRALALGKSTTAANRRAWPDAVAAIIAGAPEWADFSTVSRVTFEAVTT